MTGVGHRDFYEHPRLYDIAFDVRDTARECDFMAWCVEKLGKRPLRRALELAAGPGYHALEYASRGVQTVALDIEPAMVRWLREKAREWSATPSLEVVEADMRSFALSEPVDLAYILFGSFCYLLTHDDARAHIESVYGALSDGGVYVIELPHPRKFLRGEAVTQDEWTRERDGLRVTTHWDIGGAVPDPLTQIMDVRSEFDVEERGHRRKVRSRGQQRVFFAQELLALVHGRFRVLAWFGAMDRKVRFDYARKAWRMVPVLQKLT